MQILKIILIFTTALLLANRLPAQELLCEVEIDTRQVEGTEKKVFESLKTALFEFMNNRIWTGYEFEVNEKIECSMLLTIENRISFDEFEGSLTLALRRPVFNSNYNTVLFNYIDRDIRFKYVEFQPLDFDRNTFTSNLTSIFGFYAYLFIGLDFDSFGNNAGSPFFESAQSIVNAAQNSTSSGWKSFEDQRNRFWLLENITNPAYAKVRQFYYEYHRKGLDQMYDDPDKGRQNILKSLKHLQEVKKTRPGLFILQVIMEAKRDEFINIFSEGSSSEKSEAVNVLKELDPSHTTDYQRIIN
jgi:hypothetical protein